MFEQSDSSILDQIDRKWTVAPLSTFYGNIWVGFRPDTKKRFAFISKKWFSFILKPRERVFCKSTSHILNIPHPEHPTPETSHIQNIPHPEHPHLEQPTFPTSHIRNNSHPEYPTSPTSPRLEHPTCSICHFPSIPHSQHPISRQTNHIRCTNWNRDTVFKLVFASLKSHTKKKKFQMKNNTW